MSVTKEIRDRKPVGRMLSDDEAVEVLACEPWQAYGEGAKKEIDLIVPMQTCTRGKDCKNENGPVQPADKDHFYDYRETGGRLFRHCVTCAKYDSNNRYHLDKKVEHGNKLEILKAQRPGTRNLILFNWVKSDSLTPQEYDVIMNDLTR